MIINKLPVINPIILRKQNNKACLKFDAPRDVFIKSTAVTFGKHSDNIEFNQIISDIKGKNKSTQNKEVKNTIDSLLNCAIKLNKNPKSKIEYGWLYNDFKNHYFDNTTDKCCKDNQIKKFVITSDNLCCGLKERIKDFGVFEKDINKLTANLKQNHFDNKLNRKTEALVQNIYDDFGVKVFTKKNDKAISMIYDELKKVTQSAKKTNETLQLPKNVDLLPDDNIANYFLKTISIGNDYRKKNDVKEIFRHELTHAFTDKLIDDTMMLDIRKVPFNEILNSEEALATWQNIDTEPMQYNCACVDDSLFACKSSDFPVLKTAKEKLEKLKTLTTTNLQNADTEKHRIKKSLTETEELLAVAYERLKPNTYDEDFKELLTKLGMPKALLECPY